MNKEKAKAWIAHVFLATNCILLDTQKYYCGRINKNCNYFEGSC